MVYLSKAQLHVNTSPSVQNEIIQLCSHVIVSSICRRATLESAFRVVFQMGAPSPGSVLPRIQLRLKFGNHLLMHVYLYSGFPAASTPRPSPPPSVCIWRKSVSESASGTWSTMVAWEQISCSCVYLVLTVHTGLFFHWPWAYQHTVSLLRGLYLPPSGLKMWRHTVYKTLLNTKFL